MVKVISKPIEMITYTDSNGEVRPLRFRVEAENNIRKVIKIDKIITKKKEKLAGNPMLVFKCQSAIGNMLKIFEIKYDLKDCKWILYKI